MIQFLNSLKMIFAGTPRFGAIVLEGLIQSGCKPALVVASPDKPVGRKQIFIPPPVKITAQKYNIPVEQPNEIKNLKLKIKNLQPDLVVVAAYGQIIPKEVLDIPKYGCLNIHPSLLPKYRGPSPIQYAILNGDEETGVTVMKMTEKLDAGPIVAISKLNPPAGRQNLKLTYQELHNELADLGAKLIIETIPKWIRGEIKLKPQDEKKATYTKIIKKDDGKIDWRKSAEDLERKIRAFYSWPGSYTVFDDGKRAKKIKILSAIVYKSPDKIKYPIGKVLVVPQNEIGVQCGKNFLKIKKLHMEGKKEMTAEEFLRGYSDFVGAVLE